MFTGSLVALITPFKNGSVDEKGFEKFVAWQIKEGTDGLVPCGTTGESPTLSMEEHKRVIEICIAAAKGTGVPVIAGTGSNSTEEAIDLTRHAKKAGADAAMLVVPYYNKPTQEGLFQHFKAVAEAVDIPILLYNVPPRTGGDMQVDTVVRLSQVRNIIGIKDASYDMARPTLTKLRAKKGFIQLSGEDASAMGFMAQGGDGCISVTANVAPALCALLHRAWDNGDLGRFAVLRDLLDPLHTVLFKESNPIPVKAALASLGLCSDEVRLPLTRATPATQQRLLAVMPTVTLAEEHAAHGPPYALAS
jgi:4-hydroxy-tetrahydrodipicolinate synthase